LSEAGARQRHEDEQRGGKDTPIQGTHDIRMKRHRQKPVNFSCKFPCWSFWAGSHFRCR
jgi:hypothetical protein